jgi:sugar/nucleoside kinase (ribokinase family)
MSMTDEPIRSATFEVLKEAGKRGQVVTVDVNYRERLWKSAQEMIEVMNAALPFVTLYKSSDEEALLVSGEKTLEAAAEKLVKVVDTVEPTPEIAAKYEERYQQFKEIYPACKPLFEIIK